jgi:dihydropyrimidinase
MDLGKHVTQSGFYDEGSQSVKASLIADGAYGRDTSGHIVAIYTAPDGKTVDDPEFTKKVLDNLDQAQAGHPDQILRAMQQASHNGGLIMMHAENGIAIDVLVAQALARGETDPKYHSFTRPPELEGEATHRAIVLSKVAGNVPLYIVHMSAAEALDEVAEARHNGQNVFGETCPQYLHLTLEGTLDRPGFEGAKFVCSPPLRSKHDHRNHRADLWKGLRMNELAVVATDHCPFCFKDQKELGIGDFSKIPNGIGSVEHRMDLIFQGVVDGEISLERWVETCCTTPARMFGMYPKKRGYPCWS